MNAVWSNLVRNLDAFRAARAGNVAITFAVAALPIVGFVGFAVDFSHANSVKAAMQAALDSTALMLSKDAATLSTTDLQTKAKSYFDALFTRPEAKSVTISATYSTTGGSQLVVNGSAVVPTDFLGIIGYQNINVNGTATAAWGSTRLRVALALDNTGSMASAGKMTALKSATKGLLTQLQNAASANGDVYVSIIPFSKDVNVGTGYSSANWIDWTEWDDNNGSCSKDTKKKEYATKSKCTSAGGTWTVDSRSTWNGCVTDRGDVGAPASANYDQNVTAPSTSIAASRFPAEQYDSCPAAMLGLSYNWTAMNSLVDKMSSAGNTNQPIGLVWAWQSLVGGGPLTAPAKDSNYQYQDVIILMSDGLNTENRWSGSQTQVDKRMYDSSKSGNGTCANIKATGVTIYTIHVNTSGDPTSTLLQNCASSSDKFFIVTDANGLGNVFSSIGTNLTKLRVAK